MKVQIVSSKDLEKYWKEQYESKRRLRRRKRRVV